MGTPGASVVSAPWEGEASGQEEGIGIPGESWEP